MDADHPHSYIHQPGDGCRYVVATSPLPTDSFMGGSSDTHLLVTVWIPFDSVVGPSGVGRSYVLDTRGVLTDGYVIEKFGAGIDAERMAHVADAIRAILKRPAPLWQVLQPEESETERAN